MHIITVCLGNICRSPAAEAVLTRKLAEAGLDDVTVTSAGTADYHIGLPAFHESVAEGERRGYSFHSVAQQFSADHFADADLILPMDSMNEANVLRLAASADDAAKVVRMGAFSAAAGAEVPDVPDPWGKPREAYVRMYDQIEDAADGLIAAITTGEVANIAAAARR